MDEAEFPHIYDALHILSSGTSYDGSSVRYLTRLPLDNMAAISQTTFLNTFSQNKRLVIRIKFYWRLFLFNWQ